MSGRVDWTCSLGLGCPEMHVYISWIEAMKSGKVEGDVCFIVDLIDADVVDEVDLVHL